MLCVLHLSRASSLNRCGHGVRAGSARHSAVSKRLNDALPASLNEAPPPPTTSL